MIVLKAEAVYLEIVTAAEKKTVSRLVTVR